MTLGPFKQPFSKPWLMSSSQYIDNFFLNKSASLIQPVEACCPSATWIPHPNFKATQTFAFACVCVCVRTCRCHQKMTIRGPMASGARSEERWQQKCGHTARTLGAPVYYPVMECRFRKWLEFTAWLHQWPHSTQTGCPAYFPIGATECGFSRRLVFTAWHSIDIGCPSVPYCRGGNRSTRMQFSLLTQILSISINKRQRARVATQQRNQRPKRLLLQEWPKTKVPK